MLKRRGKIIYLRKICNTVVLPVVTGSPIKKKYTI